MKSKAAEQIPGIADIFAACERINGQIRTTPVISDPQFNAMLGCELWLKCENLQRTGAFKFRGASHAIARLEENGISGDVATHSSGNHGSALALAASNQHDREKGLAELVAKGCTPIPPYDHADIICGQGTVVVELVEQCPDLDIVITPVGGGGLISGGNVDLECLPF